MGLLVRDVMQAAQKAYDNDSDLLTFTSLHFIQPAPFSCLTLFSFLAHKIMPSLELHARMHDYLLVGLQGKSLTVPLDESPSFHQ